MSSKNPSASSGFAGTIHAAVAWCRRQPRAALLLAAILGVFLWFFGGYHVFVNGTQTTVHWMRWSWNSENDLEHGVVIFPIALFIVWYHRRELAAAPRSASPAGLAIAIAGVLMFLFAARTLQPRLAILSLPPLLYGGVRYVWGRETARIILFPCLFLVFMVPIGFIISRTVALQTLTATVAAKLSGLIGIPVDADGDTLRALDGSFQFEVAGGCSGVRSLTAMTMLAALYVHFTQTSFWKKGLVFCSSLLFALIGNFFRIFSVIVMARLVNPHVAATTYHDYSGFIFFPVAVGAMAGFAGLLNRDWSTPPPADIIYRPAPKAGPAREYDY